MGVVIGAVIGAVIGVVIDAVMHVFMCVVIYVITGVIIYVVDRRNLSVLTLSAIFRTISRCQLWVLSTRAYQLVLAVGAICRCCDQLTR